MTEEVQIDPVETTEVDVDPLITTKLTYVENLQKEIEGIQGQMASLQYQLDIRITALTMYQSTLEPEEEEPNLMARTMARKTTMEVAADLDKHEAVCAERWRETIYRIKRLEVLILTTLCALIVGMTTILSGQVF